MVIDIPGIEENYSESCWRKHFMWKEPRVQTGTKIPRVERLLENLKASEQILKWITL